jgi:hypothetical protein
MLPSIADAGDTAPMLDCAWAAARLDAVKKNANKRKVRTQVERM